MISRFLSSRLAHQAGFLTLATVVAQGLGALGLVAIVRFYPQADVGRYSVFLSYGTMASLITLLAYEFAIPNTQAEQTGALLAGMLGVLVVTTALIACGFAVAGYREAGMTALYAVSLGLGRMAEMCGIRGKKMRFVAGVRLLPPVFFLVALTGMRLAGWASSPSIMVPLTVGSFLISNLMMATAISVPYFRVGFHLNEAVGILLRFKKNALLIAPSDLLNSAAYYLPVIMIERAFGPALAAQYSVVLRFCFGPIAMLGQATANVYHADAAHTAREKNAEGQKQYRRVRSGLMLAGVLVWAFITWGYPPALRFFLGPGWEMSELFARLLAPLFGIMLVVVPLATLFYVFEQQAFLLANQMAYFAISIFSFGVGVATDNIVLAVGLFSFLSFLRYVVILKFADRIARQHFV